MKTLKKRRRVQVILVAVVALVASTALIGWALQDGINFFRSPSEVIAEPPKPTEVFRIGGLVEEGSIIRGQGETVHFVVTDGGEEALHQPGLLHQDAHKDKQGHRGQGLFQHDVVFQYVLEFIVEFEYRQLQQADGLLKLRRHGQLLTKFYLQ